MTGPKPDKKKKSDLRPPTDEEVGREIWESIARDQYRDQVSQQRNSAPLVEYPEGRGENPAFRSTNKMFDATQPGDKWATYKPATRIADDRTPADATAVKRPFPKKRKP